MLRLFAHSVCFLCVVFSLSLLSALIFYPAGDKKNPITFDGDRSVEALSAFIREKRKSAPAVVEAAEVLTHEEL